MGSKDMSTWVFGAERWANLLYYSLGGHKDVIVGCFFEKNSLDVSLGKKVLRTHDNKKRVSVFKCCVVVSCTP